MHDSVKHKQQVLGQGPTGELRAIKTGEDGALKTIVQSDVATKQLTRPANTTAYVATNSPIINGAAATSLPKISFGAAFANRQIQITGVTAASGNTIGNIKIYFFNAADINNVGGTSIKADGTAFNPSESEFFTKRNGQPILVDNNEDLSGIKIRTATEVCRKIKLDANGDLYFAPIAASDFTPASAQNILFAFYYFAL